MSDSTLCILGCGNLGTAILSSLVDASNDKNGSTSFSRFIACVHSQNSKTKLEEKFKGQVQTGKLTVTLDGNIESIQKSQVIILGVDPSAVQKTLTQDGVIDALKGRLLISVAAGWTRDDLDRVLGQSTDTPYESRTWVIRTLPNIAALVSESLTAIEEPGEETPREHMDSTIAIFARVGETVIVPSRLMSAATAVGGSTPAFWAVICDALIDAAVAVGMPRATAQTMIYQSMKGTAAMLQGGVHPGVLKDQGTSPEGCTIGGLMVLEEAGVRGHVGKALREAVTIARLMGKSDGGEMHVNDTRKA